jgi:hypothetical protein
VKAPDRHPADDCLIGLYFGGESTGADAEAEEQRRVRQHLHGCETCTWRYTELVAPLEQLRADAASEADDVFTPGRLEAQRRAIRERLEHGARSQRVIPFPAFPARVGRSGMGRPVLRWVAAAAAAGLLIGVSAGRFIILPRQGAVQSSRSVAVKVDPAVATQTVQTRPATYRPDAGMDEAFLTQVEAAVTRHRIAALETLDDLTPHAREAVMARR